jgi:hypothetical protein
MSVVQVPSNDSRARTPLAKRPNAYDKLLAALWDLDLETNFVVTGQLQ